MNLPDTIFAMSSGAGRAGVAVVRLSGPASSDVVLSICGTLPEPRRASLRTLRDPVTSDVIDRGLVLWLPGPHTATGEDMAEFHVHGSPAVLVSLLERLSSMAGCRLAEAGEFTRRAFGNQRIDLVEAEGLADLLSAETDAQRRQAMRQFLGQASYVYGEWRNSVLSALAMVEASIDFVEEDGVADAARLSVRQHISALIQHLTDAMAASETAGLVREGVRVVIGGAANAGKSSLLNWLAGRDAAIVSPVAGTTRDVIETRIVMSGVPVLLSDTAGLRLSVGDEIEEIGMARAEKAMADADVVIWVTAPDVEDVAMPARGADLRVLNKIDLSENMIRLRNNSDVQVSVRSGEGMAGLSAALSRLVESKISKSQNAIVVRERHRVAIQDSIRILNEVIRTELPLELMADELRRVSRLMGSITGHVDVEDVLGKIFSEFCIGK
jgi:tRNA modification GTPase